MADDGHVTIVNHFYNGHYGTYHARRLMQYCGQSFENVQLWLGDPVLEDDRADDA